VKDLESGDSELTTIEMTQSDDGSVMVRTRFASQEISGIQQIKHRPCRINYIVQVPRDCRLKIETISSTIELGNLEGEFEIGSVSGDVALQDLAGDIRVQSVSGQVRAEGINGLMNCENVSGNVDLIDSQIPGLKVKTVSGEILVQSVGQKDIYRFQTVSGDLTLILSESQGISIHMRSLSGKLHMHHPDGVASQPAPKELTVQGGGPRVDFETISGDLHLTTLELHQAEETAGSEDSPARQHDVLASVARGELTAEEGLQALKVSDSGK